MNGGHSLFAGRAWPVLLPLIISCGASAQSVNFDYLSLGSASVLFQGQGTGGTINLPSDSLSGFAFQIENAHPSNLDGLQGIFSGTFEFGSFSSIASGLREAPVGGTGTISIVDGSSMLSAKVSWNTLDAFGSLEGLNFERTNEPANLSDFTYSGTINSPLYELTNLTSGLSVLNFTFGPEFPITELAQAGATNSARYSGSFEAIAEPSGCAAIIGLAAISLTALQRCRRKLLVSSCLAIPYT